MRLFFTSRLVNEEFSARFSGIFRGVSIATRGGRGQEGRREGGGVSTRVQSTKQLDKLRNQISQNVERRDEVGPDLALLIIRHGLV